MGVTELNLLVKKVVLAVYWLQITRGCLEDEPLLIEVLRSTCAEYLPGSEREI